MRAEVALTVNGEAVAATVDTRMDASVAAAEGRAVPSQK